MMCSTLTFFVRCGILGIALVLAGCASFDSLAETLQDRQVNSCIFVFAGYPPFASGRAIIATGGMRVDECRHF